MASGSIVDYLKASGKDSSYAARKKLAEANGITNYTGTAAQNTNLLAALRSQAGTQGGSQGTVKPSANVTAGISGGSASGPLAGQSSSTSSTTIKKSGNTPMEFQRSQTTNDYYNRLQAQEANRPNDYKESDRVRDYYDRLQDQETNKPDPFQSRYETQIQSILDSILNNKQFSYTADDLANDSLYQMYRENYTRQGDKAMRDTMGNAAALTGGYGSTYAAAAGQQAYDEYLSQMNDTAMEFADRAYDRYLNSISDRYNQLNAVTGLDNTDYSRYRDTVSDYYTDLDYLAGRYDQEYAKDYGQYRDEVSDYKDYLNYLAGMYDTEYSHDFGEFQQNVQQQQWAQDYAFQQEQAAQEQARWQAEMDFQREQYEYQKAQAAQKASSGGSGQRSSSSSKKTSKSKTGAYAPLAAGLSKKLQEGTISHYDALETVMTEMEKGNLSVDDANMAIIEAGIDRTKAIGEEAQSLLPKNILQARLGMR